MLPPTAVSSPHPSSPHPPHMALDSWDLDHLLFASTSPPPSADNIDDVFFMMQELLDDSPSFQQPSPPQPSRLAVAHCPPELCSQASDVQEPALCPPASAHAVSCDPQEELGDPESWEKDRRETCADLLEMEYASTPASSSHNSGDCEDVKVQFPHRLDVTKEGFSAFATEDRQGSANATKEQHVDHGPHEGEEELEDTKSMEKHLMNLKLMHLLLACAEAVAEENFELASVILSRLQELSSRCGTPLQRLAVYFTEALAARIMPSVSMDFIHRINTVVPQSDMLEAFCVFYNVNPIGKFCHLTLNQVILDTTVTDTQVHLVDLHIGYGMQWAAFLQAVALRPNGPPKVRLTALGPSAEPLNSTGHKLTEMATNLQVPFEFCPLAVHLRKFDVRMLDLRQEEICVISSLGQLHTLLHKGADCVVRFLLDLKSINPKVLVFAENDADHNNPMFLNRFVECLKYYAAVFETFDSALPSSSQARLKLESLLAGRKIGSMVACEGADRLERHETMQNWINRMQQAGFQGVELGNVALNQAKLLLNLYYPNGYNFTQDNGALTLRWNGTALMAISAWH